MIKYFSGFAGIGGMEVGINDRAECIGFSEINKDSIKIYETHFPGHTNFGDITRISETELPSFDLFVGGFPCQAFSIAGKRCGFNDTRGTLFFDIARILKAKRPQHILLENVRGLLSHDEGRTFKTIIGVLSELGYDIEWALLNSKDFGVPQNRERTYIYGYHGRRSRREMVFRPGAMPKINDSSIVSISGRGQGYTLYRSDGLSPTLTLGGPRKGGIYYGEDEKSFNRYTIEGKEKGLVRTATPLEFERLQGFPDNWTKIDGVTDISRMNCCANAVTTNVIDWIISRILN